jgi:nitronate monooxygenase
MSQSHTIRTWLTERLGIRYPIIQAPMAGGPTTPKLVAAVGNAGALGSFGFAYAEPATITEQYQAARAQTPAPIHINLFVDPIPAMPPQTEVERALAALRPMYDALGLPAPSKVEAPYTPDLDSQVAAAQALCPAVLSMHFNQLGRDHIKALQAAGSLVACSVTNVAEAQHAAASGLDFVIAQGAEAGGHRGTFIGAAEDSMIGTLALVRTIVRHCTIPVVAAGGIMDGAGLAAVLALGACGAQIGTAFLPVDESGAPEVHKRGLFEHSRAGTTITRAFSGRPARGIRNEFIRRSEAHGFPILPFPIQNKATGPLRAGSAKQGNPDYVSLWAGQAYTLARKVSAAELVALIVEEYDEAAQDLVRRARG